MATYSNGISITNFFAQTLFFNSGNYGFDVTLITGPSQGYYMVRLVGDTTGLHFFSVNLSLQQNVGGNWTDMANGALFQAGFSSGGGGSNRQFNYSTAVNADKLFGSTPLFNWDPANYEHAGCWLPVFQNTRVRLAGSYIGGPSTNLIYDYIWIR